MPDTGAAGAADSEAAVRVVGVVVVTWNSADSIAGLLRGLRAQEEHGIVLDVVVVDNDSADGTVALVERLDPRVRIVRNTDNRGLSAGNNQGLLAAGGDAVLICNPDTEMRPGALAAMLDVLARRPRGGIVIPRLLLGDGGAHVSVGALPSVALALLGRRAGRRLSRGRDARDTDLWWDDWPHDTESRVPRGAESCYLVRRSSLAQVGLQDERYPLDWEGVDWSDRFDRAGWEVWFTPAAVAVHHGGTSIRQAQLAWVLRSHIGLRQYCRDRVPRAARPLVTAVVVARAGTKAGMLLLGRDAYGAAQTAMEDGQ